MGTNCIRIGALFWTLIAQAGVTGEFLANPNSPELAAFAGPQTADQLPAPREPHSSVQEPQRLIKYPDIEYGRVGQRPLKLDIACPKQPRADQLPAIVMIHGGGWQKGDKSRALGGVAPLLAEGDYVGVAVGYRLSDEAHWPAQIHDCKAAIRWLRANAARYGIDPERIGVWGSSAGGHLANLLGTTGDVRELEGDCGTPGVSSRVRCVVSYCGPTDFLAAKRIQGGREPSAVSHLLGGSLEEKQDPARQASPINYISPDDPPFLLVHGTKDSTVPFEQAESFYEALRRARVEATLVRVEGGGHSVGSLEARQRVQAFFGKHLQGKNIDVGPDPIPAHETPVKKEQVER